jgi:hypothetical protein
MIRFYKHMDSSSRTDVRQSSCKIRDIIVRHSVCGKHTHLRGVLYFVLYETVNFGLETRKYGRWDPLHWPRGTPYPQELALTSPSSGGRSVGIILSRTKTKKF